MTNRVYRFAFELFDTERWNQLLGQPQVALISIPGPTQLDVERRGLGNRLSVLESRNECYHLGSSRNYLDTE